MAEFEALQNELLQRTNERIERSRHVQHTLNLIRGLDGGMPAPHNVTVNHAADPMLNQQEAELQTV